jgi:hypothetical protein
VKNGAALRLAANCLESDMHIPYLECGKTNDVGLRMSSKTLQNLAYVALLIVLFGVTSGVLGGL